MSQELAEGTLHAGESVVANKQEELSVADGGHQHDEEYARAESFRRRLLVVSFAVGLAILGAAGFARLMKRTHARPKGGVEKD